MTILETLIF